MIAVQSRALQPGEEDRWDDFVSSQPGATLYHTTKWRDVLCEVFGHEPLYLICDRGDDVLGVLPLYLVRMPFLGAKLISIPYDIGSGGVLSGNTMVERRLVEQAMEKARERGVRFLELRYGSTRPALEDLGLARSEPVIISDLDLDTREAVWSRVAKDHRKAIRKAEKRGVELREAQTEGEFKEFYGIYSRVFRDFGTPPYGADYFPTVWRHLHHDKYVRLILAHVAGQCVGGLVMFCFGRTVVSKFAACLPEHVSQRVYPALYWRAMELSLELGYEVLSWGTSSRAQTGLIEFKERWGARHRPAVLYDLPVRGRVPSLEHYYESGGLARATWRRLPVPATTLLGPLLNRWFC